MLLQTNSYIVPKDRRAEHARLMRRFRQVLAKLGCDNFEVYEQAGPNWSGSGGGETSMRFVQIMRFRDRKHQLAVQNAERSDPSAQALINEFCELVNFQYQQQQGFFAVGFYNSVLPVAPVRSRPGEAEAEPQSPIPVGEAPPLAEDALLTAPSDENVQPSAETDLPIAEDEASAAPDETPETPDEAHESTAEHPHEEIDPGHAEAPTPEEKSAHEHSPIEPDQIISAEPPLELEGPIESEGASMTSGENVADFSPEESTDDTSAAATEPLSEEQLLSEISEGGHQTADTEVAEPNDIPHLEFQPHAQGDLQAEPADGSDQNGESEPKEENGESIEPPPPEQVRRRSSLFRRTPRNRG